MIGSSALFGDSARSAKVLLGKLKARPEALAEWNHDTIESAIRGLAEDENVKPAVIIHLSRYAVSGRTVGPSVFELLEALRRERVLRRF